MMSTDYNFCSLKQNRTVLDMGILKISKLHRNSYVRGKHRSLKEKVAWWGMCDLRWSYLLRFHAVFPNNVHFNASETKRVLILPCSSSASPLDGEATLGILFFSPEKETPVIGFYLALLPDDFKPFFIGNDGHL